MPIIVSNINSRPQRIGENSYDGSAEAVRKAVKYLISRGVMRDDIVDAESIKFHSTQESETTYTLSAPFTSDFLRMSLSAKSPQAPPKLSM